MNKFTILVLAIFCMLNPCHAGLELHQLINNYSAIGEGPAVPDSAENLYHEIEGMVVIDPAAAAIPGDWIIYSAAGEFDFVEGFTGEGCIRFTGNTEVSGPPEAPVTFSIKINTTGTYSLALRALEAPLETGEGDKANDCYVRMEGQKGWEGEDIKHVLLGGSFLWSWNVKAEPEYHTFKFPEYELDAGVHRLIVSGRSKNFFIDRIILFNTGMYSREEITGQGEE